ncbi:MAG: FABP family protein, partial [Haemophilus parainfluenzae]|nr:FABP family protein [Haemophilus parainfluenzae]
VGNAPADAKEFTVKAVRGSLTNGIISNPFLERSFTTESFEMTVKFHDDGTWSYDQTTTLIIPNYDAPFEHRDRNRLSKIGEPKLNPTAAAEQEGE